MPDVEETENQAPAVEAEAAEAPTQAPLPPPPLPEITTANAWRRATKREFKLGLPSGTVVRVRQIDAMLMVLEGVLTGEQVMTATRAPEGPDGLRERVELAQMVASRVVLDPQVVLPNAEGVYPEGAMVSTEIPPIDALAIFAWAMGVSTVDLPTEPCDEPADGD